MPTPSQPMISFDDLRQQHAAFAARPAAVRQITRFIETHPKGLFVIKGPPGKGKSALAVHLEALFSNAPFGGDPAHHPVAFFFREATADPATCIRHLHALLAVRRGNSELDAGHLPADPAQALEALRQLIHEVTVGRVAAGPGKVPPLILILDALDESVAPVAGRPAEAAATGFGIVEQLLVGLPERVYLIVTSRNVPELRAVRCEVPCGELDFDDPDLLPQYRQDVRCYVDDRLATLRRPNSAALRTDATADAIARVADGNFLIARLICHELAADDRGPHNVAASLDELLKDLLREDVAERLGYLYRHYLERLRRDSRSARSIESVLQILAFAEGDLTPAFIRAATGLSPEEWLNARNALEEFLYVKPGDSAMPSENIADEGGAPEDQIRFFHRSFTDFVRANLRPTDEASPHAQLAEACWRWQEFGRHGQRYALHHAVSHSLHTAAHSGPCRARLIGFVHDFAFIEAKAAHGLLPSLKHDLDAVARWLESEGEPGAELAQDLADAILAEMPFLERHPETLFQCLWNLLWWADSPTAVEWQNCTPAPTLNDSDAQRTIPPCGPGAALMELWRTWKETSQPGFSWLRAVSPPDRQPGQSFALEGHTGYVSALDTTADGRAALSASADKTLRLWDVLTGRMKAPPVSLQHLINVIRFCPTFGVQPVFISGDEHGHLSIWHPITLNCMIQRLVYPVGVTLIAIAESGQWMVVGGEKCTLAILEIPSLREIARWDADAYLGPGRRGPVMSATIDPSDDSVLFTVGSPIHRWQWKTGECAEWLAAAHEGLDTFCEVSRDGSRFVILQTREYDGMTVGDFAVLDLAELRRVATDEEDDVTDFLSEHWVWSGWPNVSIAELRFSRDGRCLAVADQATSCLYFWQAPATYESIRLRGGIDVGLSGVGCVAFADRGFVLCGTAAGSIQASSIDAVDQIAAVQGDSTFSKFLKGLMGSLDGATFLLDPAGRYFIAPTPLRETKSDSQARTLLFLVNDPREPRRALRSFSLPTVGESPSPKCGAISADGSRAVFGLTGGYIAVIDVPTVESSDLRLVQLHIPGGFAPPTDSFTPPTDYRGDHDDQGSGLESENVDTGPASAAISVTAVDISPPGSTVVVGTRNGFVILWQPVGFTWEAAIGDRAIDVVAISADETLVAAASMDSRLTILRAESGEVLHHWESLRSDEEQQRGTGLVFLHLDSPRRRVACGFSSGKLWWLDLATGSWTAVGEVQHLGNFRSLIEVNDSDDAVRSCRLLCDDRNDIAVVATTTGEPVAWLSGDSYNAHKVVADEAGEIVVSLGGITTPARFYVREGNGF